MANQFLRSVTYANTVLFRALNSMVFGALASKDMQQFATDENGLIARIKRPHQFKTTTGPAFAPSNVVTGSEQVAITEFTTNSMSFGELENVRDVNALVLNDSVRGIADSIAEKIENQLADEVLMYAQVVGNGAAPDTSFDFAQAYARLISVGAIPGDTCGVMSPQTQADISGQLTALPAMDSVSRGALERSRIPMLANVDTYVSQHIPTITTGTRVASGAALIDGAGQNVNYRSVKDNNYMSQTIVIDGLAPGATINKYEKFRVANVLAYNNRSERALDYEQTFTVVEDATADGTGQVELTITPPMIVPNTDVGGSDPTNLRVNSAYATVNSAPANDAAVTFIGAPETVLRPAVIWKKPSLKLIGARLTTPEVAPNTFGFSTDDNSGLSVRYWRSSTFSDSTHGHRWDTIYGYRNFETRSGVLVFKTTT